MKSEGARMMKFEVIENFKYLAAKSLSNLKSNYKVIKNGYQLDIVTLFPQY